jgi:hypothetical protein
MMRVRNFLIGLAAIAAIGCSDATGLGGENSGGDFSIGISGGATPQYSWSGADASSVAVYRAASPLVPVWHVSDPNSAAPNIGSPVRHGMVPAGAVLQSNTEPILVAGIDYRVEIRLINNSTAFRVFRP